MSQKAGSRRSKKLKKLQRGLFNFIATVAVILAVGIYQLSLSFVFLQAAEESGSAGSSEEVSVESADAEDDSSSADTEEDTSEEAQDEDAEKGEEAETDEADASEDNSGTEGSGAEEAVAADEASAESETAGDEEFVESVDASGEESVAAEQPAEPETTPDSQETEDSGSIQNIEVAENSGPVEGQNEESTENCEPEEISADSAEEENKTVNDETVNIENENCATVDNDITAGADTGNNEANGNVNDEPADENNIEQLPAPEGTEEINNAETGNETASEDNQENNSEAAAENAAVSENPVAEEIIPQENIASVETGEAAGVVNVSNDINSNLFGENWSDEINNIFGEYVGDINLLEIFSALMEKSQSALENNSESGGLLDITNSNSAEVENKVVVDVNTGGNSADGNDGDADIITGDAIGLANITNFINRNIIGNNWLFAGINVFGNWTGDLIVPGEGLLEVPASGGCASGCIGGQTDSIINENNADIENNVVVNVNTGGNSADGNNGSAEIATGSAISSANVVTVANTNKIGNNWFFLMINNMGSWVGNVINWDEETGSYDNVFSYEFGTLEDSGEAASPDGGTLDIANYNDADVTNNVTINVNTGNNSASNNEGSASITTGNASGWAKVFNFVNNNIIGNNWMMGVVNVMGSWTGNAVFAYPDLKVSIDDGKDSVQPGESLEYVVTYKNLGKADAENVDLLVTLPAQVSYQSDSSNSGHSTDGNSHEWNLGELKAGEEKSFTLSAIVNPETPDKTALESVSGVKTQTKEKETSNNLSSDTTTVVLPEPEAEEGLFPDEPANDNPAPEENIDSELKVTRNSSANGPVTAGERIKHTIILENSGEDIIYGVEVKDKMKNSAGETLVEYAWPVGDLEKNGKIMVEYEVVINEGAPSGTYSYAADAEGFDYRNNEVKSNRASIILAIAWSGYYASVNGAADSVVPTAEAAENPYGTVTVLDNENSSALPLWIWILALVSYYLAINWSLFPKKIKKHY